MLSEHGDVPASVVHALCAGRVTHQHGEFASSRCNKWCANAEHTRTACALTYIDKVPSSIYCGTDSYVNCPDVARHSLVETVLLAVHRCIIKPTASATFPRVLHVRWIFTVPLPPWLTRRALLLHRSLPTLLPSSVVLSPSIRIAKHNYRIRQQRTTDSAHGINGGSAYHGADTHVCPTHPVTLPTTSYNRAMLTRRSFSRTTASTTSLSRRRCAYYYADCELLLRRRGRGESRRAGENVCAPSNLKCLLHPYCGHSAPRQRDARSSRHIVQHDGESYLGDRAHMRNNARR